MDILEFTDHINIAEDLDEETLTKIGGELKACIEDDLSTRSGWEKKYDEWLKLAEQFAESKTYPWSGASNVKFPLVSTGAIQFHARAFPALFGNRDLVKPKILGEHTPEKNSRAQRVTRYMSTQTSDLMPGWMEDNDRMLLLLPIVGLAYKKTYYDGATSEKKSVLLSARDVIINYGARDYKTARITHVLYPTENEIHANIASGIWLEHDRERPVNTKVKGPRDQVQGLSQVSFQDAQEPLEYFESHTFYDLDDDGYAEPYICTINATSGAVVRIVAGWDSEDAVQKNDERQVVRVIREEYFTPYRFLPDPEAPCYAMGLGTLLGSQNAAINTLLNQLIDAGHLAVMPAGFLAKGARVPGGVMKVKPGKFEQINTAADDIRKVIYDLPVKEPSSVLFQLLGMLIESGKDLSSVQDMMVGRSPGQNQPHVTTQAVLEQGLKVFNGIYKRIYRQLSEELKKIYSLNRKFPDDEEYKVVLDLQDEKVTMEQDFNNEDLDIVPSAEPDMIAETQKVMRTDSLLQKMAAFPGQLNPAFVLRTALMVEGFNEQEIGEALQVEPPGPDFDQQLAQQEFEHRVQMETARLQLDALKIKEQALRDRAAAYATYKKAEVEEQKVGIEIDKMVLEQYNAERDRILQSVEMESDRILKTLDIKAKKEISKEKASAGAAKKAGGESS